MQPVDITPIVVCIVPFIGGLIALAMVVILLKTVKAAPSGEGDQLNIAAQIKEGSISFLTTEYKYLAPFVGGCAIFVIAILEGMKDPPMTYGTKGGWQTMICFIIGAALSAGAGWAGMDVATDTNVKTMEAAKTGLAKALKIAFASGAVMGFYVVALGILGLSVLFMIFSVAGKYSDAQNMREAVRYLSGFGFGASSIALFARVAGGIYTKAADVGADLVGKVEQDLSEDDPKNPATVADNVGDNVGDVAGMGADLFESFVGSIVATATLADNTREIALPFWIAGFGIFAAAVGFWTVSTKDGASQSELLHALHKGIYSSSAIVIALSAVSVWILFSEKMNGVFDDQVSFINGAVTPNMGWEYFGCVIIGLVSGVAIGEATEYATSYAYRPVRSITEAASMGGAATVIIQGLGIGMLSCVPPTLILTVTIVACYEIGSVYGIAIAAVGMLSTLGVTLATDAYGPIADNAGGIAEMAEGVPAEVRERTDLLDALGNTTAATGKGFAIGSAVLTALSLMNAFVGLTPVPGLAAKLTVTNPLVLAGVLIGTMLPFLFGALTMLSVRKAAGTIIVEVQRQFREIPGLSDKNNKTAKCDHMQCVKLCTEASLLEMLLPGAVAVLTPITIGLLVGAPCLGGLLTGSIAGGFMMAVMMSNAGGAWDNSKKYIENEKEAQDKYGKKGSAVHTAVVIGDTVGDPFKDTSGPALNILIKLMSMVSLTVSPLMTDYDEDFKYWQMGLLPLGIFILITLVLASPGVKILTWEDPLADMLSQSADAKKKKAKTSEMM